jgi:glycerol uptake facilitator protein
MATDLFIYWEDHHAPAFRRGVIGEFVASIILLFVTVGCVVFTQEGGISAEHQVQLSMMCGITVAVLVFIFAGISGAHFNSAFSWAAFLNGKASLVKCGAYTVAQLSGMVCGTLFVKVMTPDLFMKVCLHSLRGCPTSVKQQRARRSEARQILSSQE